MLDSRISARAFEREPADASSRSITALVARYGSAQMPMFSLPGAGSGKNGTHSSSAP